MADYADAEGRKNHSPFRTLSESYLFFDREESWSTTYIQEHSVMVWPEKSRCCTTSRRGIPVRQQHVNSICSKIFGKCTYESTDYSMDKKTELLQRATRGNGVDLVLIGESLRMSISKRDFIRTPWRCSLWSLSSP